MTVLRADTFDRANGALIGSTPSDSGAAWSGTGTWAITSNKANKTASANTLEFCWLEASEANVDVIGVLAFSGNSGVCGRVTDGNNCIYGRATSSGFYVYRVEAGTANLLSSNTGVAVADGDTITLSFSGDNIILKQNGTARVTTTSSFNNTATKHGLGDYLNIPSDFTSFSIESAATSGPPRVTGKQMSGGFFDLTGGTS
jgi:hypothetical protein